MPSNSSFNTQFLSRRNSPPTFPLPMKRCTTGNLPLSEDLVHDILLRLSVKSLSRCKLVCKQWRALIQSPSFMKQHFCHESNREGILTRVGIIEHEYFLNGYKYALSVDESFSKYEEPCHLQMPDSVNDLVGPLNGVYCVVSYDWPLGLLNPATRQFKPLPLFERTHLRVQEFEIGLGLDPLTGDFKLVLVSVYHSVAAVFTDSWRFLEDVKVSHRIIRSDCNTYLNGVYYWLLDYDDNCAPALLALDMRTEKFKEMHIMSCSEEEDNDQNRWGYVSLALRGDSLVMIMMQLNGCIDVWTMLNEGGWLRTSMVLPTPSMENHAVMRPVYFWKKDELLLEAQVRAAKAEVIIVCEDDELLVVGPKKVESFLISYNVCSQELGSLHVERRDGHTKWPWFFGYKESLFSLGGNCELWDTSSDYIKNFFSTKLKVGSMQAVCPEI